jgi:two-component system response regulator RegA
MEQVALIDDEPVLLQIMSRHLERAGFKVQCAANQQQFEQLTGPFEHVVLDLKFGDINGLGLITDIKQRWRPKSLIILTGYASLATSVAAIKAGASNYFAKPISSQVLIDCLRGDQALAIPEPAPQPLSPAQLEWELIQHTLHQQQGNISAAARALGMHRRTLQRKLAKHSPLK